MEISSSTWKQVAKNWRAAWGDLEEGLKLAGFERREAQSLADKRLEMLKRCHFVIESLSNELGDYGADNWTRFDYLLDEIKQEEAIAEE